MDGLLLEIPIAENDKKILENLLTKPETSSPPLESLSETAAKVLFELAINKVSLRKIRNFRVLRTFFKNSPSPILGKIQKHRL